MGEIYEDKRMEYLVQAFEDEDFVLELGLVRREIELEITKFLDYLKTKLTAEQKFFENTESRVKRSSSFNEKVRRKNYLDKWSITDNKSKNQEIIRTELSDLVGFRINCFFMDDEKAIFREFKKFVNEGGFKRFENITYEDDKLQDNGHKLNKLSGFYVKENKRYCFEVQVKSIMNNIWGEVDHKTIYKGQDYDASILPKKEIIEEVFNILKASDKQLLNIFTDSPKEKKLIRALFYELSKAKIAKELHTSALAKHYNSFFGIFSDEDTHQAVKKYVANTLLDPDFCAKESISVELTSDPSHLIEIIKKTFSVYDLGCIFKISSTLFDFKDINNFYQYLIYKLEAKCTSPNEFESQTDFIDDGENGGTSHKSDEIIELLKGNLKSNGGK